MKKILNIIIIFTGSLSYAQVSDYRDAFIGLYHTPTPPCLAAGQNLPNHYILIDKDTQTTTGIFVTDTAWWDGTGNGYIHPCNLIQSDSTYVDGAQLGKFIPTDSLKINTAWTCSGAVYYLHKIAPIRIDLVNNKTKEWYLFPNPTRNEINIVTPNVNETLKLSLLDIKGEVLVMKEFKTQTQVNVSNLPRGVYIVRISGKDENINKRIVLIE